jgi:Na+-translocating ferredoxin:NAD+ oxidoreductase subunit B
MKSATPSAQHPADAIDAVLPQTQCRKCGYADCRAYALAISKGDTNINRCPPGGEAGVRTLSALTGIAYQPLDPSCGAAGPPSVAFIDEEQCIGCALCLKACPVDAIVGAPRFMHTIIAAACTGCELCISPCPVDCIRLEAASNPAAVDKAGSAERARLRYEAHKHRLATDRRERSARLTARRAVDAESIKRATLTRAVERARARLANRRQS